MSTNRQPAGAGASAGGQEHSYFETQRAALLGEIGESLEQVLANINKLNRSLEGVIAVGNEFGSVEALWSQFENVMGHDPNAQEQPQGEQHEEDATYVTEDHAQSERDERSRSRGRSQASSRR